MTPQYPLSLIDDFCIRATRILKPIWENKVFDIEKYDISNDFVDNKFKENLWIYESNTELIDLVKKCVEAISIHFDYYLEYDKELKNIEYRLKKLENINENIKEYYDKFRKKIPLKIEGDKITGFSAYGVYILNTMFYCEYLFNEVNQRLKLYKSDVKSKNITDAKERYYYFKKMNFDCLPKFTSLKRETQYLIVSKIFDVSRRTAQGFLNNESKYSDLVSKEKIDEINETLEKLGIK